ncbi:MAG: CRISPR-associated endonuclease Cas2 [Bifidobacteriaceae bacterium]|jgi:CRISPR-associated protein Cas2|nr:CRISPR-associated endonuclease Cas2 [Bifidobacteriaceae bacterium]
MALTVLVAYDVSEDSVRARVAALLQAWGDRLQRSVFICTIDEDNLAALLEKVTGLLDLDSDSFMVMRQCADCWTKLEVRGQASPAPESVCWAVM